MRRTTVPPVPESARSMFAPIAKALRHPLRTWRWLHPYDYQSQGLSSLPTILDTYFPTVQHGRSHNFLVPHRSRADRRFPAVGWVTWDEATLLFNYGQMLVGKPLLEIGCWVGWSTVALGLSGVRLTVVDPVLAGQPQGDTCREAVRRVQLSQNVTFIPGFSPPAVQKLTRQGARWSGFFIDGDHDGEGPLADVKECAAAAEQDALILMHDLAQANIADALSWLQQAGWSTGVHHTLQFIGVAWRGAVRPLTHNPDPNVPWSQVLMAYPHLARFQRL